jgi:hypothetical protein
MKEILMAIAVASLLTMSCAPSDQPPPAVVETPAASTGDEITEMDFESGEIDESAAEPAEPAPEPTPDVP